MSGCVNNVGGTLICLGCIICGNWSKELAGWFSKSDPIDFGFDWMDFDFDFFAPYDYT